MRQWGVWRSFRVPEMRQTATRQQIAAAAGALKLARTWMGLPLQVAPPLRAAAYVRVCQLPGPPQNSTTAAAPRQPRSTTLPHSQLGRSS